MQERVLKNPKIQVLYNTVIDEVLDVAKGEVTGVRVRNLKTDKTPRSCQSPGFFVAIGHTPEHGPLRRPARAARQRLHQDQARDARRRASPGSSPAGDVQDFVYRQAVTAAGSGCMAALEAERWLARELEPLRPFTGPPTEPATIRRARE